MEAGNGGGHSPLEQSVVAPPASIPWLGLGRSILFARGIDAGARFLLFLATARVLVPGDFSLYALLTAALATCQWTLSLGAPRLALYFHAQGRREPLFGWLTLLALGASALVLAAVLAVPGLTGTFFPGISTAWILLGLAPLPFSLLADSLAATLISGGRTRWYAATLWFRDLGTAAVLLSSLRAPQRLLWILVGRLVVQAIVWALTALAARARPRFGGLSAFAPEALRYGLPTALSDGVLALHRRADVFLLAAFGRGAEIGGYALAYSLAEALWLATDSLEAALFVDIAKRPEDDARASTIRAFHLSLPIAGAAFVLGLFASEGLLGLFFSGRYPAASRLLPWTLAAAVFWGLSRPFASFLASRGRVGAILACQASSLGANLLANLILIPRLGALGSAIASLCTYALDLGLLWTVSKRKAGRGGSPAAGPAGS